MNLEIGDNTLIAILVIILLIALSCGCIYAPDVCPKGFFEGDGCEGYTNCVRTYPDRMDNPVCECECIPIAEAEQ